MGLLNLFKGPTAAPAVTPPQQQLTLETLTPQHWGELYQLPHIQSLKEQYYPGQDRWDHPVIDHAVLQAAYDKYERMKTENAAQVGMKAAMDHFKLAGLDLWDPGTGAVTSGVGGTRGANLGTSTGAGVAAAPKRQFTMQDLLAAKQQLAAQAPPPVRRPLPTVAPRIAPVKLGGDKTAYTLAEAGLVGGLLGGGLGTAVAPEGERLTRGLGGALGGSLGAIGGSYGGVAAGVTPLYTALAGMGAGAYGGQGLAGLMGQKEATARYGLDKVAFLPMLAGVAARAAPMLSRALPALGNMARSAMPALKSFGKDMAVQGGLQMGMNAFQPKPPQVPSQQPAA